MNEKKLLIGISGSVAILALPQYLMNVAMEFPNLKIIMTHTATQFIPQSSFSMFSKGVYSKEFPLSPENMSHIELARWADLFVVIPATAHLLSEVAHGAAGSLLTATIMAYEKGVIFFPNMNSMMWNKKAVQRNVRILEEDGHRIIPPIERMGFEYAAKEVRNGLSLPSVESVLSILQLEVEMSHV